MHLESATGVTKKGVNGQALHEYFCIVRCTLRGAIGGVASLTEWVNCGALKMVNIFI